MMPNRISMPALICSLLIGWSGLSGCGAKTFIVNSRAMEPLFTEGDVVFAYPVILSDLQRGDIVVYAIPGREEDLHVKRIVGLPGETIEIIAGVPTVNAMPLTETIAGGSIPTEQNIGPIVLAPNEYYILGDNGSYSYDSRMHGPVPGELIQGKVILKE